MSLCVCPGYLIRRLGKHPRHAPRFPPLLPLWSAPQAEDARRRSRVCDLHVQRNVVAVLGLLHCPLVEDLAAAHSEFGRTVR